jgi:precorrin-6B methylase 2
MVSLNLSSNEAKEDLSEHWKGISYVGKTILDIGADVGSTSIYFLSINAKHIYAVEGNPDYFVKLEHNASLIGQVTPIYCYIQNSADIYSLIMQARPDVVKIDIEGGEIHLLTVSDWLVQTVPEYIIETHSEVIFDLLAQKFVNCGYIVTYFVFSNNMKILIARNDGMF